MWEPALESHVRTRREASQCGTVPANLCGAGGPRRAGRVRKGPNPSVDGRSAICDNPPGRPASTTGRIRHLADSGLCVWCEAERRSALPPLCSAPMANLAERRSALRTRCDGPWPARFTLGQTLIGPTPFVQCPHGQPGRAPLGPTLGRTPFGPTARRRGSTAILLRRQGLPPDSPDPVSSALDSRECSRGSCITHPRRESHVRNNLLATR